MRNKCPTIIITAIASVSGRFNLRLFLLPSRRRLFSGLTRIAFERFEIESRDSQSRNTPKRDSRGFSRSAAAAAARRVIRTKGTTIGTATPVLTGADEHESVRARSRSLPRREGHRISFLAKERIARAGRISIVGAFRPGTRRRGAARNTPPFRVRIAPFVYVYVYVCV